MFALALVNARSSMDFMPWFKKILFSIIILYERMVRFCACVSQALTKMVGTFARDRLNPEYKWL